MSRYKTLVEKSKRLRESILENEYVDIHSVRHFLSEGDLRSVKSLYFDCDNKIAGDSLEKALRLYESVDIEDYSNWEEVSNRVGEYITEYVKDSGLYGTTFNFDYDDTEGNDNG